MPSFYRRFLLTRGEQRIRVRRLRSEPDTQKYTKELRGHETIKKIYWWLAIGYFYVVGYIFLARISEKYFSNCIEPTLENILKASVFLIAALFLEVGNYLFSSRNMVPVLTSVILLILFIYFSENIPESVRLKFNRIRIPRGIKNMIFGIPIFAFIFLCPLLVWLNAETIFTSSRHYIAINTVHFFNSFYGGIRTSEVIVRQTVVPGNIVPCELESKTNSNGNVSIKFPQVIHLMAGFINFKDNYVQLSYYSDIDKNDMKDKPKISKRYEENRFLLRTYENIRPNGYCLYTGHDIYFHKNMETLRSDLFENAKTGPNQGRSLLTITKENLVSAVPGGLNFSYGRTSK